ncbi:hypothetical protein [Streptomyces marincola]|uniref:Uncharacterized protein n=1 Tax=Streptomyces marincola TaxID=2878388 RepID=A0A1W7CZV1_9ACTN|nr:hypothetical protein [Streptomyces marincola]ARQ70302.1 hypothetical protein CAG99_16930 [Streptomyces marincola]
MSQLLTLNYPAPLPVGHLIEVTEYADTRPEKKRKGAGLGEAFQFPMVVDLDTGIRYMNHVHATTAGNAGSAYKSNAYPLTPRPDLVVDRVYRARVRACTLVFVEILYTQHTTLALDLEV